MSSDSHLIWRSRVGRYLVNISVDSANWYSTEGCTNYTRSLKLMAYMLFLFFTLQGCALGKIEGIPVLWTCEMIFMKKLKFSSQSRVIGVRGQQVLLENILTLYIVLVIYSQQTQMSKSLNSSTKEKLDSSVKGRRKSSLERSLRSLKVWVISCVCLHVTLVVTALQCLVWQRNLKVSSTLPSKLFDVSLHVKGFTQVTALVHPAQIFHFS